MLRGRDAEEAQDEEFQEDLEARLHRLEEEEKHLAKENDESKARVAKYEMKNKVWEGSERKMTM